MIATFQNESDCTIFAKHLATLHKNSQLEAEKKEKRGNVILQDAINVYGCLSEFYKIHLFR